MANTVIALRSSGAVGNTPNPASLEFGEFALNYADGIIYYRASDNTLGSIRTAEPSGLTNELQFNDAGSFGSSANLKYFSSNSTLSAVTIKSNTIVTPYGSLAQAFDKANLAFFTANSLTGGTAEDGIARALANSALVFAEDAYDKANSAYDLASNVAPQVQPAFDKANAAYDAANTAVTTGQANVGAGLITITGAYQANVGAGLISAKSVSEANVGAGLIAVTGAYQANVGAGLISAKSVSEANVGYGLNLKYDKTGGTISGDVNITGNLVVSGQTTYANTTTVNLGDNIITLNADIPQGQAPTENSGIEIDRGSSSNVGIIWNESSDKWTFTNDGSTYENIAADGKLTSAFNQANTAFNKANAAYDYANTIVSSGGAGFNKIKVGSSTLASAANSELEIIGEGIIQVAANVSNPLSLTISALAGAQGLTVDWGWVADATASVTYDFGTL